MKKLLTLLAVGMFALAACVPTNMATAGNNAGPIEENIPDSTMTTEDSGTDDSKDDGSDTSGSEMSSTESSESSDSMDDESSSESYDASSMDDQRGYSVNVLIENQSFSPQELTLHEGSVIQWTNNDDVSYTISIMKVSDSSDDSMDDSSDDSSSSDSMDDSSATYELTVAPGETVTYTLPDSGLYEFTISGGASLSGLVHVSDSYNDDQYDDDYMDDSMDDSYDDSSDSSYDDSSDSSYDDSSDDSYDDSSDDSYDDSSDDSYDDSSDDSSDDSYEDDYEDSEEDPESFLFTFVA
jgi:plastocyanin